MTDAPASSGGNVGHATGLVCTICARSYPVSPTATTCASCGEAGTLDVRYDYRAIGSVWSPELLGRDTDPTMWRYRPVLPVDEATVVSPLTVGGTPLYEAPRLAAGIGVGRVVVKDEGRQPTASLKDRASAMAVAKAMEAGSSVVTTASTGNAAAALAGVAASTERVRAVIFVPATAPEAKIAQLLAFGATVVLVDGTYTDAFALSMAAAGRYGWYNRNTGVNPFMTEGKKTVAFELAEQLAWESPDAVVVPVGDGSIIGGVHKGFCDLWAMGWIRRFPRIYGIQASGSDYLVRAQEAGHTEPAAVAAFPAIAAHTIADSISADLPRDRVKAMVAVTATDGRFLRISDEAMLAAIPQLAAATGVFAEPAAAAAWAGAGAAAADGLIGPDEVVAVLATGSGLKDVPSVMKGVRSGNIAPITVLPDIDALDDALHTVDQT